MTTAQYKIADGTKPGTWGLCSDGFYRRLSLDNYVEDTPVFSNLDQIEAYRFFDLPANEARRIFPDNLPRPTFPDEDYWRGWLQKRARSERVCWRSILTEDKVERHQGTLAEAIEAAEALTGCGKWAIKEKSIFATLDTWFEIAAESNDLEIQRRRGNAKGGAAKTQRKAATAAENGKKGGRPKKQKTWRFYAKKSGEPCGGFSGATIEEARQAAYADPENAGMFLNEDDWTAEVVDICPHCDERPVQNNGRGSCDTCASN